MLSAPPWPPEARSGPQLPDCTQVPSHGYEYADTDTRGRETARKLAAAAPLVVLADAVAEHPYWHPFPGGPNANGWMTFTATNFKVVRVLKGPRLGWVQTFDEGIARSAATPAFPCVNLANTVNNEPPPTLGVRYLLFQTDERRLQGLGGGPAPMIGQKSWPPYLLPFSSPWFRFPVIDGVVHSEADNGAEGMPIRPQPLEPFLRSIGL